MFKKKKNTKKLCCDFICEISGKHKNQQKTFDSLKKI